MRKFNEIPYQTIQAASKKLEEVAALCAEIVAGETLAAGRAGIGNDNRHNAERYAAIARSCVGNAQAMQQDLDILRKAREIEAGAAIDRKK